MGYRTLQHPGQGELIDRKSRFLALAYPIQSEDEALSLIQTIKESYRGASHVVYAYRLQQNKLTRYTDAGEPSGTAGLPALNVLEKWEVTDALVAVLRWFGGTLLGTGGLTRAYGGATKLAVEDAGIVFMEEAGEYALSLAYPDYERFVRLCDEQQVLIQSTEFLQQVQLTLTANEEKALQLNKRLQEWTRGTTQLQLLRECVLPMRTIKKEEFS